MPTPPLSPVPEGRPAYPTLGEHAASRRRFLKLCALSSAAATLGLPLVGCPDQSGGGGGEWVPWDEERLAGAAPMPMGQPVGVVIGGGPVTVTFSDGVQADLVVAGVFTPYDGLGADPGGDFAQGAAAHAETIKAQAATQPSSVLQDEVLLDQLENAIRDAINQTLEGGYLQETSLAKALDEVSQKQASRSAAADEASASVAAPPAARAAPAAPAPPEAAGAPAPLEADSAAAESAAPKRDKSFRRIWIPCRKPGCTNCN